MDNQNYKFLNRELSWLSFNYRVLQEAKSPDVPLFERIKFLAIFSNNLEEFFKVRVASHRSLLSLKKKSRESLKFDVKKLLDDIHGLVVRQQDEFGAIYKNSILKGLNENNIFIVNNEEIDEEQQQFASEYFDENLRNFVQPILIAKKKIVPFLKNAGLYLAVQLKVKKNEKQAGEKNKIKKKYAIVEIPSDRLPRFIKLPDKNGKRYIMFLDDMIRHNLNKLFTGYSIEASYAIKLTRDAELYLGDEFIGNLKNKIRKSLKKRETGAPCRFLYDMNMPPEFLKYLRQAFGLTKEDPVEGGRYHNYNDFFAFPGVDNSSLYDKPMPALDYKPFLGGKKFFEVIAEKSHLLYFPFQSYSHVLDFFNNAADDPDVKSIKVTQYRVAKHSAIVDSLIRAAKNGKEVIVFVELKARFDEESNIRCAEDMEKAGVKVFYSFPGLKVHAKIAVITRVEYGNEKKYCYLSTGNFNESNAKIYTDIGFFSSDSRITGELEYIFDFLQRKEVGYKFKHLLVAQFNIRKKLGKLIKNEIANAAAGKEAKITLKLNAIEDRKMIKQLYEASNAGVKIEIICRGICCLVPGVPGMSENIRVISIVDRFLEHARVYIFHNGGDEIIYASSADWMKRNLSRRVEVAFPIYEENIREQIKEIVNLQLNDNTKARIIDPENRNIFVEQTGNQIHSQESIYELLKKQN